MQPNLTILLYSHVQETFRVNLASFPPTAQYTSQRSLLFTTISGDSANAVPNYQKLCSRDSHIWGIRIGQHSRSAMAEPRHGWTTFLIMVSPLPGKYELLQASVGTRLTAIHFTQMVVLWLCLQLNTSSNNTFTGTLLALTVPYRNHVVLEIRQTTNYKPVPWCTSSHYRGYAQSNPCDHHS